jgi:hypothetical protein
MLQFTQSAHGCKGPRIRLKPSSVDFKFNIASDRGVTVHLAHIQQWCWHVRTAAMVSHCIKTYNAIEYD